MNLFLADFSALSDIFASVEKDNGQHAAYVLRSQTKALAENIFRIAYSIEDDTQALRAYRVAAKLVYCASETGYDPMLYQIMESMVWRFDELSEYADVLLSEWGWVENVLDVIYDDFSKTIQWAKEKIQSQN